MLQLTEPTIVPENGVIKAHEYTAILDAEAIIADAQERAAQIRREAEEEFEKRRQEGFDAGMVEGQMEISEKMMDTIAASVDYLSSLESSVVDIVTKSLRKILGDLSPTDRITSVVQNALAMARTQSKVTVRVSPADLESVRSRLDEITTPYPTITFVDVVSDSRLESGGCILETAIGVVDAGVETQLKAIESALSRSVTGGP